MQDVRGYDLLRCERCGFVQVAHPPSQEALDRIYQEAYFGHSKYRDEATLLAENERRLALVKQYVGDGRLLEVGCGDGSFLQLAKDVYDVYGFDVSEVGVRLARERNPALADKLWVGHVEDIPDGDMTYNTICMWDVIEHLWNPREALNKLFRRLRSGGTMFISTPNIGAPIARLMGSNWAFMTPPEHLSFLTRQSIEYLAHEELSASLLSWESLGKRANVGFIAYKAKRVLPWIPPVIPAIFETGPLSKWAIYVPTGDIQYAVIRKE